MGRFSGLLQLDTLEVADKVLVMKLPVMTAFTEIEVRTVPSQIMQAKSRPKIKVLTETLCSFLYGFSN